MLNAAGFIMMDERRRITELQNGLCWKGYMEVIWSLLEYGQQKVM